MKTLQRPFYTEFAWAYDLIIECPVAIRCRFLHDLLHQRGFSTTAHILDAGCGTGNYSIELARQGYTVTGLDVSSELLTVARTKAKKEAVGITFHEGNIVTLPPFPKYDGIICRGVLNDVIEDQQRQDVFVSFARALRYQGVVVLDVREWKTTAARKTHEPLFETHVQIEGGTLSFRSVTHLDEENHLLLVTENHLVEHEKNTQTTEYHFTMRCWTQEELRQGFIDAGFEVPLLFGDYAHTWPAGSTDRLVAVASFHDGMDANMAATEERS